MNQELALGALRSVVEETLAELENKDIVGRIWRGDHTVWKPGPEEIEDRLGWLTVTDSMRGQMAAIQALAVELVDEGVRHVVLSGLGGSSLGPEVLRQAFGPVKGYPELVVLDSTVPASVQEVATRVDPVHTLFLVSSKSGTTIEPNSHYRYFRRLVDASTAPGGSGRNFVAVTDPGTPLERLGLNQRFRHVFRNPPDLGGRYSVLSYFGLVPAALVGLDVVTLLDRADDMRQHNAPSVPAKESPGVILGATLGAMVLAGRDKLTLMASPSLERFCLWTEQLIAESTGKEGRGIVPVVGEPLMTPKDYGDDRLFVYIRLHGDSNGKTDRAIEALQVAGQPVVRISLDDTFDLGAEFYRWEFATAIVGALLGVHPFNQPDVQSTKDLANRVLLGYDFSGKMSISKDAVPLARLLTESRPGSYLAIMAYVQETVAMNEVLATLRRTVTERHRIPTTLGYGPRFLHSTGQLHKGGPDIGLFLQITEDRRLDLSIPGEAYTFGELVDAQALADLMTLRALGRPVAGLSLPASDLDTLIAFIETLR